MRKNVAGQKVGAQLISATDGSPFTGSVTVAVTIDAGTQATGSVGSGACTHEGGGYHTYSPSQAESNGDLIAFTFSGTGAIPVTIQIYTRPTTGLLAPTIADRTLDISATGEAGIDWANVGSPTTTLNLSGTTIATSQQVASVSGNIGGNVVGSVGSVSGNVGGSVGSIATNGISAASIAASALNGKGDWNIGKTGYALSSAGIQAIWDALTTALTTVGSIGKLLVDNINATISSRSTYNGSDTSGTTTLLTRIVGTLASGTHNPQSGDSFARLGAPTGASIATDIQTRLPTSSYTTPPSSATIAAAVWDLTVSGHTTSGTFGAAMNAAGSAGDPWATPLPGSYSSGTAGFIVGTNLNAQVSSRLATSGYTAPLDAAGTRTALGLTSANLDTQFTNIPTTVWANSTRILTAGTNIVLVKGTGITGFNDPTVSAISTQVNNDLTTAHGSGSYTTATGFATPIDVANALNTYDPPTNAEMEARTLLAASYATTSQVTTINNLLDPEIANMKVVIDQLATMLQGTGPYKFTSDALSLAPAGGGGGGGGDWNVDEKATIKAVLGIPATGTIPVTPTTGILSTLHTLVKLAASGAVGTVQISGTGDVKTLVFKDTDGTTTLATVQWNTATGARTRI